MTQSISPLGWVFIILFILFVVGVNVSIFLNFRKKSNRDNWTAHMRDAGVVMRNPWGKEDQRMQELSKKVEQLSSLPSDQDSQKSKIS
jgi:hypothetical protein